MQTFSIFPAAGLETKIGNWVNAFLALFRRKKLESESSKPVKPKVRSVRTICSRLNFPQEFELWILCVIGKCTNKFIETSQTFHFLQDKIEDSKTETGETETASTIRSRSKFLNFYSSPKLKIENWKLRERLLKTFKLSLRRSWNYKRANKVQKLVMLSVTKFEMLE